MRDIIDIAALSLLKTRKEKAYLLIMIGLTLFFTFIIGLAFGGSDNQASPKVPVAVADLDRSTVSHQMIVDLESTDTYMVQLKSEEAVRLDVQEGRAEVGYIIPQGFEQALSSKTQLAVKVVSLTASNTSIAISKVLEKSLSQVIVADAITTIATTKAVGLGLEPPNTEALVDKIFTQVSEQPLLNMKYQTAQQATQATVTGNDEFSRVAMGMLVQFTMFTVILSAGDILEERKNKTWQRLLVTPTKRHHLLAGKLLGALLVGVFQVTVLVLAGYYLFGVNYGNNLPGVIIFMSLFLLAVTGLGLFMASIVRTTSQLQALAPIVIVSTCMLGGCFWPLEFVPQFMQYMAKLTPQAWIMAGLRDVVIRGENIYSSTGSIIALLLFTVVFFGLGVTQVKYE